MAFFGVTIETIEKVWTHPDPAVERLALAKVKGLAFQFVVLKLQFKEGDSVIYFPVDSLIPDSLINKMGMTGKFAGPNKNRVKSIKLRSAISQGFVIEPDKILPPEMMNKSSEEITTFLGVTKYEPPVNVVNDSILMGLPSQLSVYDIEGADRFQDVIDLLMDQEVVVMEKMEGTNSSFCKNHDAQLFVNQRNNTIIEKEGTEHTFWKVARNLGLLEIIKNHEEPEVAIYGEICGPKIQDNIYELKDHVCFTFDMKINGQWADFKTFKEYMEKCNYKTIAPILFVGKLRDFLKEEHSVEGEENSVVVTYKSIQEASNGKSILNPKVRREGIVIKPLVEQSHPKLGRLIIKQRSPEYLASSDR